MRNFYMKVNMDGAAFDDPGELVRILRQTADVLEDIGEAAGAGSTVFDINGNRVGKFQYADNLLPEDVL